MYKLNMLLIMVVSVLLGKAQEQNNPCMIGDCKNSFGSYYDENVGVVYHGFYLEGQMYGAGYGQAPNGNYYISNYKNGVPDGYTMYNEGGGRTSGFYVDGLKYGDHIRNADENGAIKREVLSYYQGALVKREMFTAKKKEGSNCLAGNCENGFGIMAMQGLLIFAKFENKVMIHGEMMQVANGSSEFFVVPLNSAPDKPFFKIGVYPQEKGNREIGAVFSGRKLVGEYVVVNPTTGAVGGAIFKDDVLVEKF